MSFHSSKAAIEVEEQFQKLCYNFLFGNIVAVKSISGIKGGYAM